MKKVKSWVLKLANQKAWNLPTLLAGNTRLLEKCIFWKFYGAVFNGYVRKTHNLQYSGCARLQLSLHLNCCGLSLFNSAFRSDHL